MSSPDSEGLPRAKKRARASANDGEDGNGRKTRGRPRVDTQDATAVDVSFYTFLCIMTSRPMVIQSMACQATTCA